MEGEMVWIIMKNSNYSLAKARRWVENGMNNDDPKAALAVYVLFLSMNGIALNWLPE